MDFESGVVGLSGGLITPVYRVTGESPMTGGEQLLYCEGRPGQVISRRGDLSRLAKVQDTRTLFTTPCGAKERDRV